MIDFIFKCDGTHLNYEETPLGILLIKNNINLKMIKRLKEFPIVFIKKRNTKKLVNIIDEANNKTPRQCISLIKSIVD